MATMMIMTATRPAAPAKATASRVGSTGVTRASAAQSAVRITRRGRLVVTIAAAAGLTAVMMGAAAWIAPAPASGSVPTVAYVVQPGDTWWSIAAALPQHGDIRGSVEVLRALNPEFSGGLAAGAQIAIPRQSK